MTSNKNNEKIHIELHADDYGESMHTTEDILELMKGGYLDGVSILANMSIYPECERMLIDAVPDLPFIPYLSVHINPIEGKSLIDDRLLPWTWKKLFFVSFHLPVRDNTGKRMKYDEVYAQLQAEIAAQISRATDLIDRVITRADECGIPVRSRGLRIDSHQHVHLLPIVWRALVSVLDNGFGLSEGPGLGFARIEYIRTSHEPLGPFMKHLALGFSPVGFVKNRVLACMAPKAEKYLKSRNIKPAYLWGLIMTGHMDLERISSIMPDMLKFCGKHGYDLELNIHPGRMLTSESTLEVPEESARDFYMTDDRAMEMQTVRRFHDYIRRYVDEGRVTYE
ncbi:MAG: ChbG/HpnK family deacetylase [Lachnospiraceae bacterium]|nr:ChbG/HpnK family deacetylase [Lachnospiraceae bacterium]